MIKEVVTSQGTPAITSDLWHVVHAHFVGGRQARPFIRSVVSEHTDRADCTRAAKALRASLERAAKTISPRQRDEVFVCRPNFKSLKTARGHRVRRPKPA